jgi:RNA polymerase sigma-70 factor (ECF subfamily)
MAVHESVVQWIERWRQGDPVAAEELFRRYAGRLARVAEQRLSRRVAVREDEEDVVQSVFRSFFRRCAEGQFQIDGSNQLWQLLVTITLFKVRARARCHTADKRDVRTEEEQEVREAVSREPGPEEAAALVDLIEALLRDLPPAYGQMLELRLQGCTHREIGERLGVSRQTVHRAVTLLQRRLDRSLADEL